MSLTKQVLAQQLSTAGGRQRSRPLAQGGRDEVADGCVVALDHADEVVLIGGATRQEIQVGAGDTQLGRVRDGGDVKGAVRARQRGEEREPRKLDIQGGWPDGRRQLHARAAEARQVRHVAAARDGSQDEHLVEQRAHVARIAAHVAHHHVQRVAIPHRQQPGHHIGAVQLAGDEQGGDAAAGARRRARARGFAHPRRVGHKDLHAGGGRRQQRQHRGQVARPPGGAQRVVASRLEHRHAPPGGRRRAQHGRPPAAAGGQARWDEVHQRGVRGLRQPLRVQQHKRQPGQKGRRRRPGGGEEEGAQVLFPRGAVAHEELAAAYRIAAGCGKQRARGRRGVQRRARQHGERAGGHGVGRGGGGGGRGGGGERRREAFECSCERVAQAGQPPRAVGGGEGDGGAAAEPAHSRARVDGAQPVSGGGRRAGPPVQQRVGHQPQPRAGHEAQQHAGRPGGREGGAPGGGGCVELRREGGQPGPRHAHRPAPVRDAAQLAQLHGRGGDAARVAEPAEHGGDVPEERPVSSRRRR